MRQFTYILLLAALAASMGCQQPVPKDRVYDAFKSRVERMGMKIDSVDETGLIYVKQREATLRISLDNLRRDFARDHDTAAITRFVQTVLTSVTTVPADWSAAKHAIFVSLFPNDYDVADFLRDSVTRAFSKVYVWVKDNRLSWISTDDLQKWNITRETLVQQANANADSLLQLTPILFDTVGGPRLGYIETEETSLKPALLFAPSMREKLKKDLGLPFYAVIPVRDFWYVFAKKDYAYFSARMGKIVTEEYTRSAYPVTTEILKFTDKGVEAVGSYPVDEGAQ